MALGLTLALLGGEVEASQRPRGPVRGLIIRPHGPSVEILDEDVRFTCESPHDCEFEARWTIELRDTDHPVELWVQQGEWGTVTVDGELRTSAEIWAPIDMDCDQEWDGVSACTQGLFENVNNLELIEEGRAPRHDGDEGDEGDELGQLYRVYRLESESGGEPYDVRLIPREAPYGGGFRTYFLDAGRHEIHATGRVYPKSSRPGGAAWPVLEIRHFALTTPPVGTGVRIEGARVKGEVSATLDLYGREGRLHRNYRTRVRWIGPQHHRASYKEPKGHHPNDELGFGISLGHNHVGGPLLGAGAGFTGKTRFRMRAGYEFGSASFLAHQLTVETDFQRVLLVAGTDAALPNYMIFIPSFGGGLGLPVQVWPEARVGARVQAALSWPLFSIVGHFDVFPPMGGSAIEYHGGLYGQLSI